jgi:hypothetical protein
MSYAAVSNNAPVGGDPYTNQLMAMIGQHVRQLVARQANVLQTQIAALKSEVETTNAEVATLRSELAALHSRDDASEATAAILRAEIAALHSTKTTTGMHYCGVWKPDTTYEVDNVVTWEGGMFCAERQTALKPGSGASDDTGWRLCVRRGEPGASAFDIAKACGFRGSANEWIASLKPAARSGTAEPRR